ncbi:hypothetical protein Taro_012442 [Colocasia esculenta]|uniref:Putative plant transposon protein domain-containing protein n=1 Tax=Colocasia esculenta TaxID=4460 RepID=A0A843U8S9_COLES|nr:hypothetical protein [Colocasia esculenta]
MRRFSSSPAIVFPTLSLVEARLVPAQTGLHHHTSQNLCGNDSHPTFISFHLPEAIPYRLRHRLPKISSFQLLPARNFLRVSVPILFPILQKPFPFNFMASSGVFGSVGGYGTEFLTTEQQERFTSVKTKLCGNKAVDIANLEKYGMHSIVAAMYRIKWIEITTFSEVSYPDLVKAFFVCWRTEEDGSLASSVKGSLIRITYDLLKSLFGVCTTSHSGVHTVDTQAKGLGIVGPKFKLKDEKLDINQMNAFNRLLHFIVCQILVPRSATFSTCTKADSDMMFWAIQNQEINMAEVILERMRFAHAQIWDTKSKLDVSLPYAHLLTKIFKHFGINLSGAVVEKMGQSIRSRNLRKSGFSVVNGLWTKTSVAEGEAIIGEAQEVGV